MDVLLMLGSGFCAVGVPPAPIGAGAWFYVVLKW
jgi:hypothetical protein